MKTPVTPTFFLVGMLSVHIRGTGINMMMKSVSRSVAVKTVSMARVSVHFVKKKKIGDQFQSHLVPHWNTVAKKNVKLHAIIIPIMIQQKIINPRVARANIRIHRNKIDSLMRPKASFSTDWKPHLYRWTRCSSSLVTGRPLAISE